jgi:endoglucanase
MDQIITFLKDLTALPGLPGHEKAVLDYLFSLDDIGVAKTWSDASGNAWLEGEGPAGPPIILMAHMDEVGFRVRRIESDGTLSVIGQDHFDLRTLGGEIVQVWTESGPIPAFVDMGQQTNRPRDYASLQPDTLRLDLGVTERSRAEALGVMPGDCVTFDAGFHRLKDGILCAKAFDDRSGLAAILRALQLSRGHRRLRPVMLGTVQEEIGGHGADAAAFAERPGAVINVDICGGEVYSLPKPDRRPMLGQGPILHDGPETSRAMLRRLATLAQENDIPVQRRAAFGRGADQSMLQKKAGGLPTFGIILPMSYYHAPRGLIHPRDVFDAARLLAAVLGDEEFLSHTSKF